MEHELKKEKMHIFYLVILNLILACLLWISGQYLVFSYSYGGDIQGSLKYEINASQPENPTIGVYLKVYLKYPDNLPWDCAVIYITTLNAYYTVPLTGATGNHDDIGYGIIVDIYDKDKSNGISTGDIIHIYGVRLDNVTISLAGHHGYGGLIKVSVPESEEDYTDIGYISLFKWVFDDGNSRKNQACYSGTMISYLDGDNRILISAADSEHETWTEWGYPRYQHWAFLYQGGQQHIPFSTNGFILSMGTQGAPVSVYNAYIHGVDATNNNNGSPSYPRIFARDLSIEKIYM